MIIIWGNRPYFQKHVVNQHGFCSFCNNFSKLRSFDARSFFHLYYIPLIPLGAIQRNHKMCSKCNMTMQYDPAAFAQIINSLKSDTADAIVAVQNDEPTFTRDQPDAAPEDCVEFLEAVIDWLYASTNRDFCLGVLQQLAAPNCRYAHAMLTASMETLEGRMQQAIDAYNAASTIDPSKPVPHQRRGHLLTEQRKKDDAIKAYSASLGLAGENDDLKVALNIHLGQLQMDTKQFADAHASYERLFVLRPDLRTGSAFTKLAAKAKKKAGL